MLQLSENRETLIPRASEKATCARKVENKQSYITTESFMNKKTLFSFMENHTLSQGIWNFRDYMQFLTIMSRSDQ